MRGRWGVGVCLVLLGAAIGGALTSWVGSTLDPEQLLDPAGWRSFAFAWLGLAAMMLAILSVHARWHKPLGIRRRTRRPATPTPENRLGRYDSWS